VHRAAVSGGSVVDDISDQRAAIGLIGPRATDLLAAAALDRGRAGVLVLCDCDDAFELLVDPRRAPSLWEWLLAVGAPLRVACVGIDALDRLSIARRAAESGRPVAP
jgi:glycine cleavage system aminomethyltransferase T